MNNRTAIFRFTQPDENMSDKEKIKCLANNTGNLVFDNALGKIIQGDSIYDCTDTENLKQYERFITTSYIWIRQNEPVQTNFSLVGEKPYIPMSVGIQAADYDSHFIMHRDVVNELKQISERCVIGCRGYYTAEILNKYGIKNIQVIGCPSMYTNIFADWYVTKNKVKNLNMRVAANFSTFWRKLKPYEMDFLIYISDHKYDFVEQTEKKFEMSYVDDINTASKIKNWFDNCNIFYSYDKWSDFIRQYDFSIGYRFHGNVIALNNNVPALFIYSDSRVKEMCEFFKLPMISDKEFDSSKPIEYWYDLADYSEFNKTQNKRIENFKEFCRKNAIELVDKVHKKENSRNIKKIEIKSNSYGRETVDKQHSFICNSGWNFIEFENKFLFYSDSDITCKHLKIKSPQTLQAGKEYFLKFRVKFKTSSKGVRFFVQNSKGNSQALCYLNNDNRDDYYDVSTIINCDHDYSYLSVTSTDFTSNNYFIISEIMVEEILIKNCKKYT